jgi:hypothetical protein
MKETIQCNESEVKLTIEILPSMKTIVRFGLIFKGILIIVSSIFIITAILTTISDMTVASLVLIGMCVLYFIAGRKYLNRVFYKEIIEVNRDKLTIIDKYLTSSATISFPLREISSIGFVGQHNYTRHPLESNTMDITGFGVAEKEVQYVIEDGTIEIYCNGITRRFGKNIASWDAEEIVNKIKKFAGNSLGMDNRRKMY